MGLIVLPTMLRFGYDPRLAAGTVAATATLAQIFPPATVLVLLGDQLGNAYQAAQLSQGNFAPRSINVSDLFAGALIPGLALVAASAFAVVWGLLRGNAAGWNSAEVLAALVVGLLLVAAWNIAGRARRGIGKNRADLRARGRRKRDCRGGRQGRKTGQGNGSKHLARLQWANRAHDIVQGYKPLAGHRLTR